MARSEIAMARIFGNVWVCMDCKASQRGQSGGKKPSKCRKCGKTDNFRQKKKGKGKKV